MDTQKAEPVDEAIAPAKTVRPLEYDTRTALVTRGQMRFFLLLLAINTFLFAIFICMPTVSPFLKNMLEDYQTRREQGRMTAAQDAKDKSEAAKTQAMIDACMKYTAPADQVVYAESASDSAKLFAMVGRADIRGRRLLSRDNQWASNLANSKWQPPAIRELPDALRTFAASLSSSTSQPAVTMPDDNAVFLHEMTTPSGVKRLVWIALDIDLTMERPFDGSEERRFEVKFQRRINARVLDQDFQNPVTTSVIIESTPSDVTTLTEKMQVGSSGYYEVKSFNLHQPHQWRIYAGQPDPNNPAHLTIAYDIDGKPGVIDGWLKDGDRLMLEPRVGRLTGWNSGSEYVWDMTASAAATKPVK